MCMIAVHWLHIHGFPIAAISHCVTQQALVAWFVLFGPLKHRAHAVSHPHSMAGWLHCREVVFQWTIGLARGQPTVYMGTTPQQVFAVPAGNATTTTATYLAADMLGPRANSSGYFWPGALPLGQSLGCCTAGRL